MRPRVTSNPPFSENFASLPYIRPLTHKSHFLDRTRHPPFSSPTTSRLLLMPHTTFGPLLTSRWCVYFPLIRSGHVGNSIYTSTSLLSPTALHLSFPRPNEHHHPPATSPIRTAAIPLAKSSKPIVKTASLKTGCETFALALPEHLSLQQRVLASPPTLPSFSMIVALPPYIHPLARRSHFCDRTRHPPFSPPTTSQPLLTPPTMFNLLLAFRLCVYPSQIRSGRVRNSIYTSTSPSPPTAPNLTFPCTNRHHSPLTTPPIRKAAIPLAKWSKIVVKMTSRDGA